MAKLNVGDTVVYRDSAGFEKLGLVTGTRKSVQKGTDVPRPEKGEAHLFVISPTGKQYPRQSIAEGEGPRTFTRQTV